MFSGKMSLQSREEILSRDTVTLILIIRSSAKDGHISLRTRLIEDDGKELL
jgi:hypothetical protein